MRFACDSCGAQYMIADEKVGARGVKVKCKKCGNMIVVKPAPEAAAPAPAPVAASSPSASSSFAAQATMGAVDFGGQTAVMTPQQQSELLGGGGAFSSMFASNQSAPEPPPPEEPSNDSGNGAYTNGNHAPPSESANAAFGFSSSFGAHGGETDMALGSLEKAQAPAGSDRDGERTWYVAIEDAQVGPVNLAEVEERWDNKEIDEDTLVWKAGMGDWIPLVDVAELAYLITERPQAARGVARAGATAAAGSSMGVQSAFAGGSPQAEIPDEPSWRPSAASALSSLVQEELIAKKPDAPEPMQAPKGMEGLGIPNLGASDIFGSGGNGGTPITMGQPAVAPAAADPFGTSGSPAWSVPSARRHSGSGMGTKIVVGLLFVAVLGLGGFMVYLLQHQQQQVVVKEVVKEVAPPAPVVAQADPNAPPVAPPLPPQAERREPAKAKATHEDKPEKAKEDKPEKVRTKTKVSDDPLDQIDNASKPPPAAAVKDALSKDDIIEGVKANGSKLGPCVTAARGKDEIQPGRVQFVLDWNINPNGSVTAARLKGPPEVMNTSLPSCFGRVMGSWKFAASKSGAPITNFPLPITVR